MLTKMYYVDIECHEKCLLCGASSTTVRTWMNHNDKCEKKDGNPRLSDAKVRRKEIIKTRKLDFYSACRDEMEAGDRIDDGKGSGKRKADDAGLPPQRQQFGVRSIDSKSNTKHRSVAIGMLLYIVPQFGFIVLK
jgi:hypothetical protein